MHHLKVSLLACTLSTTKKKKKNIIERTVEKASKRKERRILSIRNIKEYY